ncbi:hypothetical protein AB1Y20_003033 [Prymnesium parvum]|uniref:Selenoprotein O n=1 Tax=Prymnesium parvum TaxID=97485 RepID=A0AB34JBD3_PRYPA
MLLAVLWAVASSQWGEAGVDAPAQAGTLDSVAEHLDNSYVRELLPDPDAALAAPNKSPRSVRRGHFVLLEPTPLPSPYLVACSAETASLIGLAAHECASPRAVRLLSGDTRAHPAFAVAWATPYALSIYGAEVLPEGAGPRGDGYGDGRAVSIGELLTERGERWEVQLKGAGRTPFCRGADGRAVLRSSAREFVASEAMAALRVPTTRALSLVASAAESVRRPWYSNVSAALALGAPTPRKHAGDVRRAERAAITARVARSFLRVGQLELYARRARRGEPHGREELELLARHALRREYAPQRDGTPGAPLQPQLLRMVAEASRRFAHLAAEWLRVGYVQSNFNSDNCLLGGATLDYGPFGFIEKYDAEWGMWISSGKHFAFMNQPAAAAANFKMLAASVEPLLDESGRAALREVVEGHAAVSAAATRAMWSGKLGFISNGTEETHRLWVALESLMARHPTDYTILYRQLADVADEAAAVNTQTVDEAAHRLLPALQPAFYQPLPLESQRSWTEWIVAWLAALRGEAARVGRDVGLIGQSIRSVCPKFVPREWMLHEAYSAAERGDHQPLLALHELLKRPYDEQPAVANRYYVRAPPGVEQQGGIGFMS